MSLARATKNGRVELRNGITALPAFPETSLFPFVSEVSNLLLQTDPVRLQKKTLVTGQPNLIRALLRGKLPFHDQSAFYRIGQSPVDPEIANGINSRIVKLLKHAQTNTGLVERGVTAIPLEIELNGRTWGVRAVHAALAPLLAPRSSGLQSLIADYITTSIIPDDMNGRRLFKYTSVLDLRHKFSKLLTMPIEVGSDTLARIIYEYGEHQSSLARGELYQRLVLAFVGFTGIALEWCVLAMNDNPEWRLSQRNLASFVKEVLRLYCPAWRLVRTANEDFVFSEHRISEGDSIWASLYHLHRDPHYWPDALTFDPRRWDGRSHSSNFLPFGFGPNACPASSFAPNLLVQFLAVLGDSREFSVSYSSRRTPLVLTLFSPPDYKINFRARSDSRCTL